MCYKKNANNMLSRDMEFLVDEGRKHFLLPELLGDVPYVRGIATISRTIQHIRDKQVYKRLWSFVQAFRKGEKSWDDFERLKLKERNMIIEILFNEVYLLSDDLQAMAMGYVVIAYMSRKIDASTLKALMVEIKRTSPALYDFNKYKVVFMTLKGGEDEATLLEGDTNLLPPTFVHPVPEEAHLFGAGVLASPTRDGSARGLYAPSDLGTAFMHHVYKPMSADTGGAARAGVT